LAAGRGAEPACPLLEYRLLPELLTHLPGSQAAGEVQRDGVLDGGRMTLTAQDGASVDGQQRIVHLVFGLLPQLFEEARRECKELVHLAAAGRPAQVSLAGVVQADVADLALVPARWRREALHHDFRDDVLARDVRATLQA
jgi:hypothetical protein